MRSNLLVKDGADLAALCVIEGERVFDSLNTSAMNLVSSSFRGVLAGSGKKEKPYQINTFIDINTYIQARDQNKQGTLYFSFCGVNMYQNGIGTSTEQDYYIGLLDESPLSYPDMGKKIDSKEHNVALNTVNPATVKTAVGTGSANKYEVLALAALFLAEGRRNRTSLLTHLLLMDLIEDKVKFGKESNKVRSLRRAVDISGASADKLKSYETTALGDSPMAHKGAVKDARAVGRDAETETSRYKHKTISIAVQWVAHYFGSPQFILEPCKPGDDRPGQVLESVDQYATRLTSNLKKKSSEKAGRFESRKSIAIAENKKALASVPNAILAFIRTMFDLRLEFAKGRTEAANPKMQAVDLGNLKVAATTV